VFPFLVFALFLLRAFLIGRDGVDEWVSTEPFFFSHGSLYLVFNFLPLFKSFPWYGFDFLFCLDDRGPYVLV